MVIRASGRRGAGSRSTRPPRDVVDGIGPATAVEVFLGFTPPPEDADDLRSIRATAGQLSTLMGQIIDLEDREIPLKVPVEMRGRAEQLARDLYQSAAVLAHGMKARAEDLIAQNAASYQGSRISSSVWRWRRSSSPWYWGSPFRGRWSVRSGHRRAAGRDRVGRVQRARRRREPRRARRPGRERQPDERRAQPPLHGARGDQPPQVGVPREHVARAAHTAQRDPGIHAGASGADVRRHQCEAGGVPRRHPLLREPPPLADQRRARSVQGRGRAGGARDGAVLAHRGTRARGRRRAGAGQQRRGQRRHHRGRPGRRHRRGRRAPDSAGPSSTCSRTPCGSHLRAEPSTWRRRA